MSTIEKYAANIHGRDLVVGDIHGMFSKLQDALNAANFDEKTDRLFSVGDLVDRGPENELVLDWLAKPWFHAVLGNHDHMAMDVTHTYHPLDHVRNGGQWFLGLPEARKQEFRDAFSGLPIAIELKTSTHTVGIVHAGCPFLSWGDMAYSLENNPLDETLMTVIWDRSRIDSGHTAHVDGIDWVVVGHNVVNQPRKLGNHIYIDTGACRGKDFTLLDVKRMVTLASPNQPAMAFSV